MMFDKWGGLAQARPNYKGGPRLEIRKRGRGRLEPAERHCAEPAAERVIDDGQWLNPQRAGDT